MSKLYTAFAHNGLGDVNRKVLATSFVSATRCAGCKVLAWTAADSKLPELPGNDAVDLLWRFANLSKETTT